MSYGERASGSSREFLRRTLTSAGRVRYTEGKDVYKRQGSPFACGTFPTPSRTFAAEHKRRRFKLKASRKDRFSQGFPGFVCACFPLGAVDVNEKRNVLIENIRFSALIHDLAAN